MRVVIGGDHAGLALKNVLAKTLRELGHDLLDIGTHGPEEVDFPDITAELCRHVLSGEYERGLLICGTGVGAAIAANKTPGIRAAVCHDVFSAHQSVEHDDVNVMCIGGWIVGERLAQELVERFLGARFNASSDAFVRRVAKLSAMDRGR
jgi:ribose 5-phosphate isomerase B